MPWPHGGLGTEESPYLVPDADALDDVRDYVGEDVYFKQTANIDLAEYQEGEGWVPILANQGIYFDFGDYVIEGLRIDRPESNEQGLFSVFTGYAYDVNIQDAEITARSQLGFFAGVADYGNVTGYTIGDLSSACKMSGRRHMGSVFGWAAGDTSINEGFANADIEAENGDVFGLGFTNVSQTATRAITKGIFIGTLTGGAATISGIGNTMSTFDITDCAAYATLNQNFNNGNTGGVHGTGSDREGGTRLISRNVSDCVFNHDSGSDNTGGITSDNTLYTLQESFVDNYWNQDEWATDKFEDAGNNIGLTEAEFKDATNMPGLDFTDVWFMLTQANIEALHPGYGTPAYDALPAKLKDKPWLRILSDVIVKGITPESTLNALFFGGGL